jgi:hypothetical protein
MLKDWAILMDAQMSVERRLKIIRDNFRLKPDRCGQNSQQLAVRLKAQG